MSSAPGRIGAKLAGIATYLPDARLDNVALSTIFESWTADKIFEKTGIRERRIAAPDETALDLGVGAAQRLFEALPSAHQQVDFIIFCTQAPDYVLPTSACLMQSRLGLPTTIGALDINLGCSGYVYGLSLATGLIASGAARSILFVTADTYSKFIHPLDRSVRTLFGDGASATLIVADEGGATIGPFVFGTDGSGGGKLIVEAGGARCPSSPETAIEQQDEFGNIRTRDNLFMDGSAVMSFTLREVPRIWNSLCEKTGISAEQIDFLILHQANRLVLDALVKKLKVPAEKVPYSFQDIGNTVSSTIPFALKELLDEGALEAGSELALIGFGVGLSWAACLIRF